MMRRMRALHHTHYADGRESPTAIAVLGPRSLIILLMAVVKVMDVWCKRRAFSHYLLRGRMLYNVGSCVVLYCNMPHDVVVRANVLCCVGLYRVVSCCNTSAVALCCAVVIVVCGGWFCAVPNQP